VGKGKAFQSHYTARFTRSLVDQQKKHATPDKKDRVNVVITIAVYHF